MSPVIKLESPYKYRERILIFGAGGHGKSECVAQVAANIAKGSVHVVDGDYSRNYERAREMGRFGPLDNLHVYENDDDWEDFQRAVHAAADAGDPTDDWLVIDPSSPSWAYVQSWYSLKCLGEDLADRMATIRAETDNINDFNTALSGDMTWPLIKREYERGFYRPIQRWRGHLILIAEAKELDKRERDDDVKATYGHVSYKPVGEGRLHHVTSTTLFVYKKGQDDYQLTTVKDRQRPEIEKEHMDAEDAHFANVYLRDVAGWLPKVQK